LRAQLEDAGIVVEATNYGRLDVLRFLWGSRRLPVDKVWNSVRDIKKLYPDAEISFLAHSFGTYIVSRLLQREFDFKAHRVAFCGSIVRYDFPFNQIAERFTPPIVNETSALDPWPVLGESCSWGYGSAGTYGFKVPRVRDRWHRGFGHSQYLTKEFCAKFWVPFFRDGMIVEGDLVDEVPPLWVRLFSIIKIKYLLLALATASLITAITLKFQPFDIPGPKQNSYPSQAEDGPGLGAKPSPPPVIVPQSHPIVWMRLPIGTQLSNPSSRPVPMYFKPETSAAVAFKLGSGVVIPAFGVDQVIESASIDEIKWLRLPYEGNGAYMYVPEANIEIIPAGGK
jgi:hypothetical protein